jgi:hypothetical protein
MKNQPAARISCEIADLFDAMSSQRYGGEE